MINLFVCSLRSTDDGRQRWRSSSWWHSTRATLPCSRRSLAICSGSNTTLAALLLRRCCFCLVRVVGTGHTPAAACLSTTSVALREHVTATGVCEVSDACCCEGPLVGRVHHTMPVPALRRRCPRRRRFLRFACPFGLAVAASCTGASAACTLWEC